MCKRILPLVIALILVAGCAPAPTPSLEVRLETPANGSTVGSLSPVLSWSGLGGATSYRLQVAADSNFQELAVNTANLTDVTYTVTSGTLANDRVYYWRVNASKGSQASGWSGAWSFRTPAAQPAPPPVVKGTTRVIATLDGSPWSGAISYRLTGPDTFSGSSAPQSFSNLPAGEYALTYQAGGPPGATLASISPSPTQNLPAGSTITYTLNFFVQQANGTIMVNATLDGAPWQTALGSGSISYTVVGPRTDSGSAIPSTFSNQPAGVYALSYNSGGPIGATLAGITPSSRQTLAPGGTIVFTLNFYAQAKGTVVINATLNGEPWSGDVGYVVQGPYVESGYSVPQSTGNAPAGTYTVTYRSGGPPSAIFRGVVPSRQALPPGGTITFTLNFIFQGVIPPVQ